MSTCKDCYWFRWENCLYGREDLSNLPSDMDISENPSCEHFEEIKEKINTHWDVSVKVDAHCPYCKEWVNVSNQFDEKSIGWKIVEHIVKCPECEAKFIVDEIDGA